MPEIKYPRLNKLRERIQKLDEEDKGPLLKVIGETNHSTDSLIYQYLLLFSNRSGVATDETKLSLVTSKIEAVISDAEEKKQTKPFVNDLRYLLSTAFLYFGNDKK